MSTAKGSQMSQKKTTLMRVACWGRLQKVQ
jgi:hypothetical protein